jgi:hypothetical protein
VATSATTPLDLFPRLFQPFPSHKSAGILFISFLHHLLSNLGIVDFTMSSLLLLLPRELRDLIYDFYVRSPGGYIHNFESNKLLRADGRGIQMSLAFACRQIASKMAGLALATGTNAITFLTYCSKSTRQQARRFHSRFMWKRSGQSLLLKSLAPKLLTLSIAQAAATQYPILV